MELDTSPIQDEIDKILSAEMERPFYSWNVYFRIRQPNPVVTDPSDKSIYVDEQEKDNIYKPLKVMNIDFRRDYEQNVADEGSINVTFGLGLWYKVLQPYRDYIEAVITKKPKTEFSYGDDNEREIKTYVYYAIPKVDAIGVGEASNLDRYSRDDLDIKGLIDIEFQLLDLSIEKIRSVTVGGIFRKAKSEDVIKGILSKETKDIQLSNDGKAIEHFKIVKADNVEKREHILIPHGTTILDVPHYIHKTCGGVYSTGMASYIQNKVWYIFPPYNTQRLDQEDKSLTIIKVPSVALDEAERTYRQDGNKLIVMATSDSHFDDKGDEDFKNLGNGIRFSDARRFMDGLVEVKDNKAVATRSKLNHEFLYKEMKIGDANNNNVSSSSDFIHSNPFMENTKLALREGNAIAMLWKNSNADLLYPGMPVRVLYLKNKEVKELNGSLLKVHESIMMKNKGVTSKAFQQQCVLFVYVNKMKSSK